MTIQNLEGAIEQGKTDLEGKSDRTNPYYSDDLLQQAVGYLRGLRMAHQIMTGVRK